MRRTLSVVPALFVAATLALAGCGGSTGGAASTPSPTPSPFEGQSAQQVLKAAQDAAAGATSVHVKGTGEDDGQEVKLDLTIQYGAGQEKTAVGTLDIGSGPMEVRRVGDTMYIKAGAKFWKENANEEAALLFADKWLSGSVKKDFMKEFAELAGKSLITEALKPDNASALKRVPGIVIDGQQTVGLDDTEGTLYISTGQTAFPVRVDSVGDDAGTFSFGDWNAPVKVTEPRNATDFDKLMAA